MIISNKFTHNANVFSSLDSRNFATINLEPKKFVSPYLRNENNQHDFRLSILFLVLSGSLHTPLGKLSQGTMAIFSSADNIMASQEGCLVSILIWKTNNWTICNELLWLSSQSKWYKKYEAWVGKLNFNGKNPNPLSPWTAYMVELQPFNGEVSLHLHQELNNLIFIQGQPNVNSGYFIIEENLKYLALPLKAGDIILVKPGVKHNLVSSNTKHNLKFFVFNNSQSDYQQEESSDYHLMKKVPWSAVDIQVRFNLNPILINVG
ncbi:MAG: hypothetical protein F6K36_01035 [Symploca sp. SIO3C6]|uniref:Cupin n=1 Tax=Symploca sp. SIO1C4 TaxID=2607765 RepID=A0A6B3NLM5_9CYAN|nr:hypothetical protein [Symploca sp. SIO3C6]NER31342.1 hypothetical protein [Symploca sp. SIO1C4]